MNDNLFDNEVVKVVYSACVEAGIDYMEIGYINSKRIFSSAITDTEKSDYHFEKQAVACLNRQTF